MCEWQKTTGQNCGWTSGGGCPPNALPPDSGIQPSGIQACRAKCEGNTACVAINFAHPGEGGSGGPGSTSSSSGTCYYRTVTSCGQSCSSGRDCWSLTNETTGTHPTRPCASAGSLFSELHCDGGDDDGSFKVVYLILIIGVVVVGALCCAVAICISYSNKKNTASSADTEHARRLVLEQRLAHVRAQLPDLEDDGPRRLPRAIAPAPAPEISPTVVVATVLVGAGGAPSGVPVVQAMPLSSWETIEEAQPPNRRP